MSYDDLSSLSLEALFRLEVEGRHEVLVDGLLALERGEADDATLEELMRAAHSIKGASSLVGADWAGGVAHALEDVFVSAQEETLVLGEADVDGLLAGADLMLRLAQLDAEALAQWMTTGTDEIQSVVKVIERIGRGERAAPVERAAPAAPLEPAAPVKQPREPEPAFEPPVPDARSGAPEKRRSVAGLEPVERSPDALRITAARLDAILGLVGEVDISVRWLTDHLQTLRDLSRRHRGLTAAFADLEARFGARTLDARTHARFAETRALASDLDRSLGGEVDQLDDYERRLTPLVQRLHRQVLGSRMRPFGDILGGLPRLVRELARDLGKQAQLEIAGRESLADRDVLGRLDAALNHLVRNAIDHGIETPEERAAAGKDPTALIRIEGGQWAGRFRVVVSDDGRGVDLAALRDRVLSRGLAPADVVRDLGEDELLEFLFLPKFSTRDQVTTVSGRGVGLDAVRSSIRRFGGAVEVSNQPGVGMRFELSLPISLAVTRTLVVAIGGEAYALPMSSIERVLRLPVSEVCELEGRQYAEWEGEEVGLVAASDVLDTAKGVVGDPLSVVLIGGGQRHYGLIVDRFVGHRDLAVRPLDPRLGEVQDISAVALLDDGTPVIVLDVDDLVTSIERLVRRGRLRRLVPVDGESLAAPLRILVVEDSITVRELERKLLAQAGYEVDVAVDGMAGWHAVSVGEFDLLVTDIDMPRMDGLALVERVRAEPSLAALPVIIVSYKDQAEHRARGLAVGADAYVTKSSFDDDSFLKLVADLIGDGRPEAKS